MSKSAIPALLTIAYKGGITSSDHNTNYGRIYNALTTYSYVVKVGQLIVNTNLLYSDTENFRIGIKTTSPQFELDVVGTIQSKGGSIYVTQSSPVDSLTLENFTAGAAKIYLNAARSLYFGTNSTMWMELTSTGSLTLSAGNLLISSGGIASGGTDRLKWKVFTGALDSSSNAIIAHGCGSNVMGMIVYCLDPVHSFWTPVMQVSTFVHYFNNTNLYISIGSSDFYCNAPYRVVIWYQ